MAKNIDFTPTIEGKGIPGRRRFIYATLSYSLLMVFLLTGLLGMFLFPAADDWPLGWYTLWGALAVLAVGAVVVLRYPFLGVRIGILDAEKFNNRDKTPSQALVNLIIVSVYAFSFWAFGYGLALIANASIGEQNRVEFPCTVLFIDKAIDAFGGVELHCRDDAGKEWGLHIFRDEEVDRIKSMFQKGDRVDVRVIRGSLGIHYVRL